MSRTNTFSLLHCGAPQTVHAEDSHVGVYMEEEGVGMRLQVGRVLGRRQVPMDRSPNWYTALLRIPRRSGASPSMHLKCRIRGVASIIFFLKSQKNCRCEQFLRTTSSEWNSTNNLLHSPHSILTSLIILENATFAHLALYPLNITFDKMVPWFYSPPQKFRREKKPKIFVCHSSQNMCVCHSSQRMLSPNLNKSEISFKSCGKTHASNCQDWLSRRGTWALLVRRWGTAGRRNGPVRRSGSAARPPTPRRDLSNRENASGSVYQPTHDKLVATNSSTAHFPALSVRENRHKNRGKFLGQTK